jgi:hypothetical protein
MIADLRPSTREFIADHLQFVARYTDTAQRFVEMGDDNGLEYSIRKLVEYVKGVARATGDILRENEAADHERAT